MDARTAAALCVFIFLPSPFFAFMPARPWTVFTTLHHIGERTRAIPNLWTNWRLPPLRRGSQTIYPTLPKQRFPYRSLCSLSLVSYLERLNRLLQYGHSTVYSTAKLAPLYARRAPNVPLLPEGKGLAKYPLDLISSTGNRGSKVSFSIATE
jgi:hypothetical protein